jgi:translation elongation factor EF-1alpha
LYAKPGENVKLKIIGIEKEEDIKKGNMICSVGENSLVC